MNAYHLACQYDQVDVIRFLVGFQKELLAKDKLSGTGTEK